MNKIIGTCLLEVVVEADIELAISVGLASLFLLQNQYKVYRRTQAMYASLH
jgi:hypothetical protein